MKAPKSFRLHIGIFGRRNVGKSSLLNALTHQEVSIVSEIAGTTTDPVEKPMELLPLGPVLFIDTAGTDDEGSMGNKRIAKTRAAIDRSDIGILVSTFSQWDEHEQALMDEFTARGIPFMVVFNKSDVFDDNPGLCADLEAQKIKFVCTSATQNTGFSQLRQMLLKLAPDDYINRPAILADLVGPGEAALLVVPIDDAAPKGRLILPQVQSIRDLLDNGSYCTVVRDHELAGALARFNTAPKLVVTDSQAFEKVAALVPQNIPLTSFSILFARYQGDLSALVRGAVSIDTLQTGDKVLIAEACSHHPAKEDIATVKIPRWLQKYVGGKLHINNIRGHEFPANLADYKLIIHCGACMWNRREMLNRIMKAVQAGVPITNYGLTIAYSLGIFERALQPFPEALAVFKNNY